MMRQASAMGKRSPARTDTIAMRTLRATLLIVCVMIIARNPGLAADLAYGEYLAA